LHRQRFLCDQLHDLYRFVSVVNPDVDERMHQFFKWSIIIRLNKQSKTTTANQVLFENIVLYYIWQIFTIRRDF